VDSALASVSQNWPTTVEAAVKEILARLPEADRSIIKAMRKEELIKLHFTLGLDIRNRAGLWSGESLMLSACGTPCHPDDASMRIIEAVWLRLNN
jgi:hypothetical protein